MTCLGDGDLIADLADGDAATRDLNGSGITHRSFEGLARFLLRAEAVTSSRIEGQRPALFRLDQQRGDLQIFPPQVNEPAELETFAAVEPLPNRANGGS